MATRQARRLAAMDSPGMADLQTLLVADLPELPSAAAGHQGVSDK
ncbi:hypothetical protein SRB17_89110 [Streptomyces sp. RB17]|nr:hypothetical protein [Streptomyces sp. RB17]MQY40878.1 hypothetical protein [Streptomyces sp. RB17]